MSVEIDEHGTVTAGGRPVDYATAYAWCVDSPETITELVQDTKAFVMVIAAAEQAAPEEQAEAVRQAFAAGVPRDPGASWTAAAAREPADEKPVIEEPVAEDLVIEEPAAEDPVAEEPAAEDPVTEEPAGEVVTEELPPVQDDPAPTRSGEES